VEVRVKRAFQEGILEVCWESWRPMSLRKVSTSGTKGVGGGIGRDRRRFEAKRRHWQVMVTGVFRARMGRLRIIVGVIAGVEVRIGTRIECNELPIEVAMELLLVDGIRMEVVGVAGNFLSRITHRTCGYHATLQTPYTHFNKLQYECFRVANVPYTTMRRTV
jgi:hypothetical protein